METHAAASGVFPRNSTSPPVVSYYASSDDSEDEGSAAENSQPDEPIEVDPTFLEDTRFPGTVKITVGATPFWCAAFSTRFSFLLKFLKHACQGHIRKCWSSLLRSLKQP